MSWAPPPLSVQHINAQIAHDVLVGGWPQAPGGSLPPFTEVQAAGILAQFQAESDFDPTATGDKGPDGVSRARGIGQWWGARRGIMRDGVKDAHGNVLIPGTGIDLGLEPMPPLVDQVHAAMWELWHPERPALEALMVVTSPRQAGITLCKTWMRPRPPDNSAARGDMAEVLYSRFNPPRKP